MDLADPQLQRKGAYSPLAAYAQSKLAELLFVRELQRRLPASARVRAFCLHPGNVMTDVVRTLPPLVQRAYKALLAFILMTPAEGR